MENNPYNPYDLYDSYDPAVAWGPQQGQIPTGPRPKEEPLYEDPAYYAHHAHSTTGGVQRQEVTSRRQQAVQQGTTKPARMSKAETLELVDAFKKSLIVASIVGFGVLGGLAASHVTGVTSSQAAPSSPAPSINSPGSQSPSNSDNSGGFFNQGNQGGYQFGSGNSQSPSTSSRTS